MGLTKHDPSEAQLICVEDMKDDGSIGIVVKSPYDALREAAVQRVGKSLNILGAPSSANYSDWFVGNSNLPNTYVRLVQPGELLEITR